MLKTGMIIAERYEIVSKIGTGGMADVYKAMDHKLNRFVAVKVLKPEFREDATFVKKFRSEAQAAAAPEGAILLFYHTPATTSFPLSSTVVETVKES